MPKLDLSHVIEPGLITYKGIPAPHVCDYLSREASKKLYAEGTSFQIGRIDMIANTGTYLDAPFHRYEDGRDVAGLDLDEVAGLPGLKVEVPEEVTAIGEDWFEGLDIAGKAVLVATNWSRHWKTESYYENFPFLTAGAAEALRSGGARLVGIDSHNIDDTRGGERPVHSTLLGAGIPIVEHLCNLRRLPNSSFRCYAVPVKVRGMGTFPVRAFAEF